MNTKFWIRRYPDVFGNNRTAIIEGLLWTIPEPVHGWNHLNYWEDLKNVRCTDAPAMFNAECTEVTKCAARKWLKARNAPFSVDNIPITQVTYHKDEEEPEEMDDEDE